MQDEELLWSYPAYLAYPDSILFFECIAIIGARRHDKCPAEQIGIADAFFAPCVD